MQKSSNQNFRTIPDIISRCIELDVDHINISALHTSGTAFRNFWMVTPRYNEIQPYVFRAVDRAIAAGCVVTLEGFPYCSIPGYEQHSINWSGQQFKLLIRKLIWEDYERYMDAYARVKHHQCANCAQNHSCGGVYKEYAELIGWGEFQPFPLPEGAVEAATPRDRSHNARLMIPLTEMGRDGVAPTNELGDGAAFHSAVKHE